MTKERCIAPEIQAMLHATPNTEGLAEQIRVDIENLDSDPEFVAEFMKMQFVEDIFKAMHEQGINRNQLAAKLGKSRQYVGRVLNENANFTLDTLAEFACALDMQVAARLYTREKRLAILPAVHKPQLISISGFVPEVGTVNTVAGGQDDEYIAA